MSFEQSIFDAESVDVRFVITVISKVRQGRVYSLHELLWRVFPSKTFVATVGSAHGGIAVIAIPIQPRLNRPPCKLTVAAVFVSKDQIGDM